MGSKKYKFIIRIDTVRQGLLKLFLVFSENKLQLDVFIDFKYAGLTYLDINKLFIHHRKLDSNIWVPNQNYELAISFLKDFLHNSNVRHDKIDFLRSLYIKNQFNDPFINIFSKEIINDFKKILFLKNQFIFKKYSKSAKINLLKNAIKKNGFFRVIFQIFTFFFIKYFYQSIYNKYIFVR